MSFIIVENSVLEEKHQDNSFEKISIQELSFMHLSALTEILKGNKSDLNFKLYRATKAYIDEHIDIISIKGKV